MSVTIPALETTATISGGPVWVGSRLLATRYVMAPLAGYTHLAFRRVVRELGGVGLATTDLVHSSQLLAGSHKSALLIETHPDDQPLSVQIFGSNAAEIALAARWLQDAGYQGIDLNMGCPMAKVNGQGGGARLMCNFDGTTRLVEQVIAAVQIPVTVKMRLGWDATQITAPEFAARFEELGVAAITLHGRTRSQGFGGNVSWDGIAATKSVLKRIPLFGNGDVRTPEEALAMRQAAGCDGIAFGRGAMLDPWVFRKLAQLEAGQQPQEPTPAERVAFLLRHFDLMTEQHGERSCVLFRKFAAWYGACLGIPEDLEDRLRRFESLSEFHDIAAEFRERQGERSSERATALIKVPNGPVEHW
jgi:tRNA-dihydrouridine synthase B